MDDKKRVLEAENEFSTIGFEYDDQGRLLEERSPDCVVTYHRDEIGNIQSISATNGVRIDIKRDRDHRITQLIDHAGNVHTVSYALNGAMESITYPNGVKTDVKTNKNGYPVNVKTRGMAASQYQADHSYDACDRLVRTITDLDTKEYSYDPAGRLTRVDSKNEEKNEFFSLDANGNVLEDKNGKNVYSMADKFQESGAYRFFYDEHGRVVDDGFNQYEYNGRGQVIRVINNNSSQDTIEYKYDALGRRIRKKLKSTYTIYIWAGQTLLSEKTIDNTFSDKIHDQTDYLFFPSMPMPVSMIKNDELYCFHTGQRNEVLFITDKKASVKWQAEYTAHGKADILIEEINNPFRLTGQYFDSETGLHYNLARYYNPDLGRFYTRDPLFVDGGSGNFYIYCNGDPINRIDPTGEFVFCAALLVGAVAGAIIGAGLEAYSQHKAIKAGEQEGYDLWGVAKAGGLGGVLGGVGAAVGIAAGGIGVATSVAGFAGVGFVEGIASTFAEQCTENALTGSNVGFSETLKNALIGGAIGAVLGTVTVGAGGVHAGRVKKALSAVGEAIADSKVGKKVKNAVKGRKPKTLKASVMTEDPVNLMTGGVMDDQSDFLFPGKLALDWTRSYSSQSTYKGQLGHKWQTPADSRLEIKPDGEVYFYDGGAGYTIFDSLPGKSPVKEIINGAVLSRIRNTLQVLLKSGKVYSFKTSGLTNTILYVDKIHDSNMNWIEFFRQDGELKKITNNSGCSLDVYCESGKIKQIYYTGPDSEDSRLFVSYDYDSDENLISVYDAFDNPLRFEYINHLMVKHSDRNGNSYCHEYDEYTDQGKCIYAYGDDNFFECTINYEQGRTRFTNSLGFENILVYDENHLPLEEIDHNGYKTVYTYDQAGRCTSITDKLDRITCYIYDEDGNNTSIIRPDNEEIVIQYENNLPVQIDDPRKNSWHQEWNDKGQLVTQTSPVGAKTGFRYNKDGELVSSIDAVGNETHFITSTLGAVESIVDEKGNKTQFTHDDLGNIIRAQDAMGNVTRYTYDAKSRLSQVAKPSGSAIACQYDNQDNLTQYQDENGQVTKFEHTFTGKVAKKINPDGTQILYTYDTEDQLISVKNEREQTYLFKRDHAGNVTHETDYYGNTSQFVYNPRGLLLKTIDPLQRATGYSFDNLDRLTHKRFYKPEDEYTPYKTESYEYDANSNLIAHDNDDIQITRSMNALNQVVTETQGDIYVYNEYNILGRRTRRQSSLGNMIDYEYDELGNPSSITINNKKTIQIQRDEIGLPVKETFSGSLTREYSYNTDGQLTHQHIGTNGIHNIERTYNYDRKGNLTEQHDSVKGSSYFSYDPMDRISQYINPENRIRDFLRDPAGDLIKHQPYDQESSTRTSIHKDTEYVFDAVGNLIETLDNVTHDLTTFTWDEKNCLITADKNGTLTDMTYDATGRRISKETNGEKTQFFWDNNTLLADRTADQTREFVYYPGTFEPLAVVDKDQNVFYFNNDLVGLPREVTTDRGEILWSASYDAHGKITNLHEDRFDNPLRLQGQYFDPEIGLCYNRHRYYDPDIGSFISADPLGLEAGTNNYAYAPNVWSWIDPLGLCMSAPKNTDLKVLGRLDDTAVAKNWKGHDVLDIPDWTMKKNMEWVDQGVQNKQDFYTASPESGNMIQTSGRFKGEPTIYAQEIRRIKDVGYVKKGDYYVHPNNVGTFKP